jgi:hypothetical protein
MERDCVRLLAPAGRINWVAHPNFSVCLFLDYFWALETWLDGWLDRDGKIPLRMINFDVMTMLSVAVWGSHRKASDYACIVRASTIWLMSLLHSSMSSAIRPLFLPAAPGREFGRTTGCCMWRSGPWSGSSLSSSVMMGKKKWTPNPNKRDARRRVERRFRTSESG